MTIEHRIVVGLGDIKAVSLECNKCHTRITLIPDGIEVPPQCPKCGKIWISGDPSGYQAVASPYVNFFAAIGKIRTLLENGAPFKILLEFDDEQT
jgi:hypothetical protein